MLPCRVHRLHEETSEGITQRIAADVRTWAEGGGLGGHHASDCAPDTSVATFTPRSSPFDQK